MSVSANVTRAYGAQREERGHARERRWFVDEGGESGARRLEERPQLAAKTRHRRAEKSAALAIQSIVLEGKIKEARGRAPRLLKVYLFLAVLRRAVPVFFAVDFLAAAVLRAGFFFAVFLFAAAIVHPSFGWLAVNSL